MKRLVILRGLPGAGKTDLTRLFIAPIVVAGDHYRDEIPDDPRRPGEAEYLRRQRAIDDAGDLMRKGMNPIVLEGVFTDLAQLAPLLLSPAAAEYRVTVLHVETDATDAQLAARNAHGADEGSIAAMRAHWKPYDEARYERSR